MYQELNKIKSFLEEYRNKYPEESGRIEKYLNILEKEVPKGVEEKLVLAIFRSVVASSVNPWDIDLRAFLESYKKIIEVSEDVDFFIASQIILYAVTILYKKSEDLARVEEEVSEDYVEEDRRREEVVLRVVRREKQRITLVDILKIVESISSALKEGTKRRKRRSLTIRELEVETSYSLEEHVHREVDELVERVRRKIASLSKSTIPFHRLASTLNIDVLSAFIVILFLIMDGEIEVLRRDGEIMVRVHGG
ncbi:MAG: hypothetical protein J7J75_04010 [Euryarchaeota archaeon]|nr:hypothetical protein [Euryarchaeota archaeon]